VKYFNCAHGFGHAERSMFGGGAFSGFSVGNGSVISTLGTSPAPSAIFLRVLNPNLRDTTLTLRTSMNILSSFSVNQLALIIPIVALLVGTVIVVAVIIAQIRNRQLWHETARLALEKGQPLPPLYEIQEAKRSRNQGCASDDIRSGLISIAVGAALYLFLGAFIGGGLRYVGAIPAFIGIALLLFGIVRSLTERKSSSIEDRPRQS
jgi:hypothetical protein